MRNTLLTLVCLCWPLIACAKAPYEVNFHPEFHHITIPEEIIIDKKVSIDAPVGDFQILSPILSVKINGKGPYYFMFDTGWSQSMIAKRVANELHLPLVGNARAKTITPNQVVDTFHNRHFIESLTIGGMTIKNYAVESASDFEDDAQMFSSIKGRIDGVLGPSAFYGLLMTIDYKKDKIHFYKGDLNAQEKNVIPYAKHASVPNVKLTINFSKLKTSKEQTFIVDTGNYSYIYINSCSIPEMHRFTDQENLKTGDFTGNLHTDYFAKLFGNIYVYPGYAIDSPYITFSQSNCSLPPRGLLGRKFFDKHLVTIDHDSRLVKIIPY